jgi:ankyrin repeat protein
MIALLRNGHDLDVKAGRRCRGPQGTSTRRWPSCCSTRRAPTRLQGHFRSDAAGENGHETVIKLLLDNEDVDPDSKDEDGRTPLLWTTRNGHETAVMLLQRHGVLSL